MTVNPQPGSIVGSVADAVAALGPDLAAKARALATGAPDPTPEQLAQLRSVFVPLGADTSAA